VSALKVIYLFPEVRVKASIAFAATTLCALDVPVVPAVALLCTAILIVFQLYGSKNVFGL
jgi:hypothetical protein